MFCGLVLGLNIVYVVLIRSLVVSNIDLFVTRDYERWSISDRYLHRIWFPRPDIITHQERCRHTLLTGLRSTRYADSNRGLETCTIRALDV